MSSDSDNRDGLDATDSVEERAALAFLRQYGGAVTAREQADLEAQLLDPVFADAYARAADAWKAVGDHATSPEMITLREQALGRARQSGINRWLRRHPVSRGRWAAAAMVVIAVGSGVIASRSIERVSETAYETGIGEQRVVELEDRSRIALDAQTRMRVRLTAGMRTVELFHGQAQFMVATDPRRPFQVEAGAHVITAVGTSFNVEYLDERMDVAMVEGKVAVSVGLPSRNQLSSPAARVPIRSATRTTDLVAGQTLRVAADGQAQLVQEADISATIAWRQGKIILNDTPLGEAVRRFNRYSRLQIRIDDASLAELRVSGVFDSTDALTFVEAVQSYLPIVAHREGPDLLRLSPVK